MDRLTRLLVPALVVLFLGCSAPRTSTLDRTAIKRSVEQAAALVDPVTGKSGSAELDRLLREAMRESARVDARLEWWRFTERTDLEAWSRVAHLASMHARDIRSRRGELEDEWNSVLERAEDVLHEVESHPVQPPSPKAAAGARKAVLELGVAKAFVAEGRLPDATAAALRSIQASESVLAERDRRLARFDDPANLRAWNAWASDTIGASARNRTTAIVVEKLDRKLHVYEAGKRRLTFDVELGSGALARKLHQGDRATPEGHYKVREVRGPRATKYYRALLLDYPNEEDQKRFRAAKERGELPAKARIGGLIEIHGQGGQGSDWTEGCVALSNEDMDRLVKLVRVGTRVTIVGRLP